jgi:translation initiation factor 1
MNCPYGKVKIIIQNIIQNMGKNISKGNNEQNRVVYAEFGNIADDPALERATPNLPPQQQNIRVQATSKGRKGKTVTVITGFQESEESLTSLLKKLKTQFGAGGTLKEQEMEIQGDHTKKLLEILGGLGYKVKKSGG